MSVTVNDKPWRELVMYVLNETTRVAQVGIFDGELAKIGAVHEYGAPRAGIPERSWLRSTLRERAAEIVDIQARIVALIIERKIDGRRGMEMLARFVVGAVKEQIMHKGKFAPVTAETQRRKGPDKTRPLVNTGQLANSVTAKIV